MGEGLKGRRLVKWMDPRTLMVVVLSRWLLMFRRTGCEGKRRKAVGHRDVKSVARKRQHCASFVICYACNNSNILLIYTFSGGVFVLLVVLCTFKLC